MIANTQIIHEIMLVSTPISAIMKIDRTVDWNRKQQTETKNTLR